MRWNLLCGLGLSVTVFLGAVNLASSASAQAVAAPVAGSTAAPTTSAKHAALENLRKAHRLLATADRDYDGHRARAAEEVHKAIRALEGKHRKKAPGTAPVPVPAPITVKPAKPKSPAAHEPQATSDAQLQAALQLLQASTTEINARHPRAASNVAAAIRELNMALKIK